MEKEEVNQIILEMMNKDDVLYSESKLFKKLIPNLM